MAILSKEEAQALLKKVLAFSKADECEVKLNWYLKVAIFVMHVMLFLLQAILASCHWP